MSQYEGYIILLFDWKMSKSIKIALTRYGDYSDNIRTVDDKYCILPCSHSLSMNQAQVAWVTIVLPTEHQGVSVDWCLTALSAQTGYIVPQDEIYSVGPGDTRNT